MFEKRMEIAKIPKILGELGEVKTGRGKNSQTVQEKEIGILLNKQLSKKIAVYFKHS
jgi:hypothetical protein